MMCLSDTPKFIWSKRPVDIPLGLVTTLKAMGYHEMELENVALDLMDGDWRNHIGNLF